MTDSEYEKLRDRVIQKYKVLYKDSVAMDACEIDKQTRIRLFDDPVYIAKTKAIKANLFANQLSYIDSVLAGVYQGEKLTGQSSTVLKAVEMKQKMLLEDLNIIKDDSNAVNVTFMEMDRAAFEALDTTTVSEGSNNSTELGADFGAADDDSSSFEARMKAQVQEKMKELEEENGDNS